MPKSDREIVYSGQKVLMTGYYVYKGSPHKGEIPVYLENKDKVKILKENDYAPQVPFGEEMVDAAWKFVTKYEPRVTIPISPNI